MATAKRLGSTAFGDLDPLDDLRPTQKKKVFPFAPEEELLVPGAIGVPAAPEPVLGAEASAQELSVPEFILPPSVEARSAAAEPLRPKSKSLAPAEPSSPRVATRRVRFSANVAVSIKERAENASYWIPGMTISAITEVALERELRRLEKEHNAGKPFKPAGKLKYGRPRVAEEG